MAATNLLCKIAGTTHLVKDGSFRYTGRIEEQSRCAFTIRDDSGTLNIQPRQAVEVSDSISGSIWFTGFVGKVRIEKVPAQAMRWHQVDTMDNHLLLQEKTSNSQYEQQYAGAIAVQEIKPLVMTGQIQANFALDQDTTQADFASGTHSNTVATADIDNGCLQLAPAGTVVNFEVNPSNAEDNITSHDGYEGGSYISCATFKAIQFKASCTISNTGNAYLYMAIHDGDSRVIQSADVLSYKILVSKSSPKRMASVDVACTDGTNLRNIGGVFDGQWLAPHSNTDLTGYADNVWYFRRFNIGLSGLVGKTIKYVSIAFGGDDTGDYAAWFRDIKITNGGSTVVTIFSESSTALQQIPQTVLVAFYTKKTVTIVDAYEMESVILTDAISVAPAGIYKSSIVTLGSELPTDCEIKSTVSVDQVGGTTTAVFQLVVNNQPIPGMIPGMDLADLNLYFYIFLYNKSGNPTVTPKFKSLSMTVNPSYIATKTDVKHKTKATADYSGTLTNLTAASDLLYITGYQHALDFSIPSVTLYGKGTPGYQQYQQSVEITANRDGGAATDAKLKISSAGDWQNFRAEVDLKFAAANIEAGLFFRTTNYGDGAHNYAYRVAITTAAINFGRGSNSSSSSAGTFTSISNVAVTLSVDTWYHLTVITSTNFFSVELNGVRHMNGVSDSTYSAAGGMGLFVYNNTGADGAKAYFKSFGVVKSLSGTYVTPAIDISGAGTSILAAFVRAQAQGDMAQAQLKVELSLNNGSSYSDVTVIETATQEEDAFVYLAETLPGLGPGTNVSSITQAKIRLTLSIASASAHLELHGFIFYVLSAFSSSGNRISSALLLDAAGSQIGSMLIAWHEIKPSGTTVVAATSLGGSYTDVSNGGAIAGLVATPAPVLDSFNTLTSSSYTSTTIGSSNASWTWDTANSRVTGSGGNNAILRYDGLSIADSYAEADFDQANDGGLICRLTATGCYALYLYDSAVSNQYFLYVITNSFATYTLIASGTISFTRGNVHRFRLSCIGTTIKVLMDGKQLASVINSGVSGAGKVGLLCGNLIRCYNLRIQQIGESATGKMVYTRHTFTSTDPEQTPRVTGATTIATDPDIAIGSLLDTADYRQKYKSANISDLAQRSDLYWLITAAKRFTLLDRRTVPAPFVICSNDPNLLLRGPLSTENTGEHYRNREILTGVLSTVVISETKTLDGTTTSWTLQYNVLSVSSVALNSQPVAFGEKSETGKTIYWESGSNSIALDGAATNTSGDILTITYTGQAETKVERNNTGQFPNTVSQKQFREQSGLQIPVLTLLNQASAIQLASSSSDDFDVSLCRVANVDISITANSGTNPTVQFFFERKAADGTYHALWASAVITASSAKASTSIGPGAAIKESLGITDRIRWTIGGTSSPSVTFSVSITARCDPNLAGIGIVEHVTGVTGQNMSVPAAQELGDKLLERNGKLNAYSASYRYMAPTDGRPPLAEGQYLTHFIPEHNLNDVSMLITSLEITQQLTVDPDTGQSTQKYYYQISATESINIGSWAKSLKETLRGKA